MTTIAFVYKWTHIPTLKWYVGSRTRKNCHPNDGYTCSSHYVKAEIKNNPTDWHRTIIASGEPIEMRLLEAEILQTFNAKKDPRSFNRDNGDGNFSTTGKPRSPKATKKQKEKLIGRKYTEKHRLAISAALSGKPKSETHRKNLSIAGTGQKHSIERRINNSKAQTGILRPGTGNALRGRKLSSRPASHSNNISTAKIDSFKRKVMAWSEEELTEWLKKNDRYKSGKGKELADRVKNWRNVN